MREQAAVPSDGELVEAVRCGDVAAFEVLYRRHMEAVRAAAIGIVGTERAGDAVQETFLKCLERLDTLGERDRFRPWLLEIARDSTIDEVRVCRDDDFDEVAQETVPADGGRPDGQAELKELAELVRTGLLTLTSRDAWAVSMSAYLDYSPPQVGQALGISPSAANLALDRVRERLRRALSLELLVRRRGPLCAEFARLHSSNRLLAAARHAHSCQSCQAAVASDLDLYEAQVVAAPEELACVMVSPGTPAEQVVPIKQRLFIGRECVGIDDANRLVLDDPEVSRDHAEIRLQPERRRASVIDTSTNGTRVNGVRIERAIPTSLKSGDKLLLGNTVLEFNSAHFRDSGKVDLRETLRGVSRTRMVMVVGDIAGYTALAENSDSETLASAVGELFGGLRALLRMQQGALSSYAGDALFATWELDHVPDAAERAVEFALAAAELVSERAPDLPLRDPDGAPIRMGWAVVSGEAAISSPTGTLVAVLGDAVNVAFRLSAIAARSGRPDVLVSADVRELVGQRFRFEDPEEMNLRGRAGAQTVFGVRLSSSPTGAGLPPPSLRP